MERRGVCVRGCSRKQGCVFQRCNGKEGWVCQRLMERRGVCVCQRVQRKVASGGYARGCNGEVECMYRTCVQECSGPAH